MIHACCPHCGRLVYAHDTWAGTTVLCPGCHGQVPVERPSGSSSDEPVRLACPRCRAPLRVPHALAGQRIFCTACGVALSVTLTLKRLDSPSTTPHRRAKPPARPASPAGETIDAICPCGANLHALREYAGRSTPCPNCGSTVAFPAFAWDEPPAQTSRVSPPRNRTPRTGGPGKVPPDGSPRSGPAVPTTRQAAVRRDPAPEVPTKAARWEGTVADSDHLTDQQQTTAVAGTAPRPVTGSPPAATPTLGSVRMRLGRRRPRPAPPWLWPLIVASAATCAMIATLLAITFAP